MLQSTPQVNAEFVLRDLVRRHHDSLCTSEIADLTASNLMEGQAPVPIFLDEANQEIRRDLANWHLIRGRHPALVMCRR